jgi:hypothetical protein
MIPTDIPTLDPTRADILAEELSDRVGPTVAVEVDRPTSRRWARSFAAVAAAAVVLTVGVVAFDGGRSPAPAEAMFTVTPHGDWINIAPNLDGATFDADSAVDELRGLGFDVERGTFREWIDEKGDRNTQAPEHGGLGLGSHAFEFVDGTAVIISIEGPAGAEFPLSADGTMLDWDAAAEQFGFRNPLAAQWDGLELRRDAPVTIYVHTRP